MFIRKVTHRNKKREYTYYRLVENVRIGDKVKQRTILNLGQLNLAKEKHPFLVGRIREYLNGQIPLLSAESEIESLAFYYFQQIRNREAHLRQLETSLFNLKEHIILYDLTNTYLEGSGKFNHKARFGRSKEKRSDWWNDSRVIIFCARIEWI